MSEKEEDGETIDHWSHEHPLTQVCTFIVHECNGCLLSFKMREPGYACSKRCGYTGLLHEACAEMPRKLRHPMHPQHLLMQERESYLHEKCAICKGHNREGIGYNCTSSECVFQIHVRCVLDDVEQGRTIQHPSHPQHELRLLSSCLVRCNACGTRQIGLSYLCSVC